MFKNIQRRRNIEDQNLGSSKDKIIEIDNDVHTRQFESGILVDFLASGSVLQNLMIHYLWLVILVMCKKETRFFQISYSTFGKLCFHKCMNRYVLSDRIIDLRCHLNLRS